MELTLSIMEVLKKYSSKEKTKSTHPLTYKEITDHLVNEYYSSSPDSHRVVNYKKVRSAMEKIILSESYFKDEDKSIHYTSTIKKDGSEYKSGFYTNRQITDIELKFLIDSVMHSKIFDTNSAKSLATRVQQLSGKNLINITNYLTEHTFGKQRLLSGINVLDNVKEILKALDENKIIIISYNKFKALNDGSKVLVVDKIHEIVPLKIILNDGRYYLFAYYSNDEDKRIYTFSLDLISKIVLGNKVITDKQFIDYKYNFHPGQYILNHPFFMGGKEEVYKLRVENNKLNRIINTFSYEAKIIPNTTNDKTVDVYIKSSAKGMALWLISNYDVAELVESSEALDKELKEAVKKINDKFKSIKNI